LIFNYTNYLLLGSISTNKGDKINLTPTMNQRINKN